MRAVAVVVVILARVAVGALAASPVLPCPKLVRCDYDVAARDQRYETELLIVDGSGHARVPGAHASSAACTGCRYRVVPACPANRRGAGAGDAVCTGAVTTCPPGQLLFRIFVQQPPQPWRAAGTECLGGSRTLIRRGDVTAAVRRYVGTMPVPTPVLHVQPDGPGIVGVPTIFYVVPAQPVVGRTGPHGLTVTVTAAESAWTWRFGDGTSFGPAGDPGARHPDATVSHEYERAGRYVAGVTATWRASYAIAGLRGTTDVGAPIHTTSTREVAVREAHGELIAG